MSKEPLDYSDSQDKVDYQVVKSYGRASKSRLYFLNSYTFALFVIFIILLLIILFQTSKIRNLETKVKDLEGKVTYLEGKVTYLEGKVTELESQYYRR